MELSTGITNVLQLTRRVESFAEWDVFRPIDGSTPIVGVAKHYAVGGLVLFVTRNLAVDIRAGAGLNSAGNRFVFGTGFAIRH